ncbi:chymotrypsin family serine protease [Tsukamurella soli]|uniref:hypothetical protein n=1 Tax=Tsukamurella soli TaxID=644556 RepID=UPI003606E3DE
MLPLNLAAVPAATAGTGAETEPIAGTNGEAPRRKPICLYGAHSGISCGPLTAVDTSTIRWDDPSVEKGDGGAPVFAAVDAGGICVNGVLSGDNDSGAAVATYVVPALSRLGVTIVRSPGS